MYSFEDYLGDALELVSFWDLPDDDVADAVIEQAQIMAHCCPDTTWEELPFLLP